MPKFKKDPNAMQMHSPYKVKGSPMQRNYGIPSPAKNIWATGTGPMVVGGNTGGPNFSGSGSSNTDNKPKTTPESLKIDQSVRPDPSATVQYQGHKHSWFKRNIYYPTLGFMMGDVQGGVKKGKEKHTTYNRYGKVRKVKGEDGSVKFVSSTYDQKTGKKLS